MSTTVTFASGIKTPARDENLGQNAGVWPPTSRTLYVDSRGRKSLPMCSSRIQQDIPLVQIERYFLQAPALGHDRSRATAALGGGGGSRTTSSRQRVRRVNTSRIIRIAAGRGPGTQGLNDQSSSNSPGERAGAACAILGSFQSGPYHVAWRFSFPFIRSEERRVGKEC